MLLSTCQLSLTKYHFYSIEGNLFSDKFLSPSLKHAMKDNYSSCHILKIDLFSDFINTH